MSIKKLLVLDTSFALEAIRNRGLQESVTCRDLDGYFEHVWSVHPFASLVSDPNSVKWSGFAEFHRLTERHTFIDGKMGRFSWLEWLPKLNFLLGQIALITRLIYLIKRENISVVRAADPLYNGLIGLIISKLTGVPLLVRVGANHDKSFETTGTPMMPRLFPSRRIEKAVGRFVLERAECVAGANQDNLDFAIANGAHLERTTLFRYGNLIDRLHFTDLDCRSEMTGWLEENNIAPKKFLMFVGRLEPVKHPDDPIKVLAELKRRGHEVKLLMVGDGQLRDQLSDLATNLGISDQVVFCGNQNQGFLASMYPLAAVVLSPHTGRALAEAALAGAKIVAYDVDWQGEMVESGITGELVAHMDWMQMADAANRILNDSIYAHRIGSGARDRALEMMDPDLLDEHERATYTRLLNDVSLEKL
ncbi:glycosyltransferase [Mariprofundus sp. NF]|uniref:glycosyltransferase n=1 Tax=Mariprofundus sp. NF TaxID=2608716 RepID=UPI0015A038E8|nr:glycosyltransferase [Mariprofundus sp. NF]NWF39496.1 glycosyltransferase [Mariprofundus sp. NF]